jgi:hypothetical protein
MSPCSITSATRHVTRAILSLHRWLWNRCGHRHHSGYKCDRAGNGAACQPRRLPQPLLRARRAAAAPRPPPPPRAVHASGATGGRATWANAALCRCANQPEEATAITYKSMSQTVFRSHQQPSSPGPARPSPFRDLNCPTGPAGWLAGTGTDAATNGSQSDRDVHDSRQRADKSAAQFAAVRTPNGAPRRRVARGGATSNASNPSHNRPPHTTTHTQINTQPQIWSTYILGQARPPQHGLTLIWPDLANLPAT